MGQEYQKGGVDEMQYIVLHRGIRVETPTSGDLSGQGFGFSSLDAHVT